MKDEMIEFLIESGSEITGATTGAVIGGVVAGPAGAMLGIAGGKAVEKVFSKLGSEIKNRVLSKRENNKIGATATYALEKIDENIKSGKKLRDDGFFENDDTNRSTADEIVEGIMFSAQREHEEKKLKYYGNLVANIAFDKTISREQANQLINISKRLTYRQLKLINLFAINQQLPIQILRKEDYTNGGVSGCTLISVLQDTLELYNIGLVGGNGSVILEMPYIAPADIRVQGMGAMLYNLMELSKMPYTELEDLIEVLK